LEENEKKPALQVFAIKKIFFPFSLSIVIIVQNAYKLCEYFLKILIFYSLNKKPENSYLDFLHRIINEYFFFAHLVEKILAKSALHC
jgi:hypothetical protein